MLARTTTATHRAHIFTWVKATLLRARHFILGVAGLASVGVRAGGEGVGTRGGGDITWTRHTRAARVTPHAVHAATAHGSQHSVRHCWWWHSATLQPPFYLLASPR